MKLDSIAASQDTTQELVHQDDDVAVEQVQSVRVVFALCTQHRAERAERKVEETDLRLTVRRETSFWRKVLLHIREHQPVPVR